MTQDGKFGRAIMIRSVLVTGDRGYIGSVLVSRLLGNGYSVVGLDSQFYGPSNLHYKQITKDIRDIEEKDLKGIDAVIHLAALSNDPLGSLDPKLTREINYSASIKLAELSRKSGIKRFLFSSSCSVYGKSDEDLVSETSETHPLTSYAKSKVEVENQLNKISDKNFCAIVMRNATVYGYSPKFRADLVVNNLVASAVSLGKIIVNSDGSPWRPLIDVRDLSSFFIGFLEIDRKKIVKNLYNVGFNRNNFQVKDIADAIKSVIPSCCVLYKGQDADSRSYRVDFSSVSKLLPNIVQEYPLKKSVRDLVEKLKKMHFSSSDFLERRYERIFELKKLIRYHTINESLRFA